MVVHVIASVAVYNVNIVGIAPIDWPRVDETERVAAIIETPAVVLASADVEAVPTAKTGSVVAVGDAAMLALPSGSNCRVCRLDLRLAPSRIALIGANG